MSALTINAEKEDAPSTSRARAQITTKLSGSLTARALETRSVRKDQHSPIELLPTELKLLVLSFFEASDVHSLALTGPVFYRFVRLNESRVCRKHYGYPAARNEASAHRTIERHDSTMNFVHHGFSDEMTFMECNKTGFYKNFQFTLKVTERVQRFHEIVRNFAWSLATMAIQKGPIPTVQLIDVGQGPPECVIQVSSKEQYRYMKALYIFELASGILPWIDQPLFEDHNCEVWHYFWKSFQPWEQHQVRCIQAMMQGWVEDLVAAQGGFMTIHPSDDHLAQFVIHQGVMGLEELQRGRLGFAEDVIERFLFTTQFDSPFPPEESSGSKTWI
ncbi:hypothetical protein ABKA04_009541 [Annulohypoxylon sp. FPYF3050]